MTGTKSMAINIQQSIFSELADFLASQPTLEDLAAYQVSDGIQRYIDELLDKNREGGLSAEERLEMEKFLAVTHVMNMTKVKAKFKLAGKT
jgi:hypothetical protein